MMSSAASLASHSKWGFRRCRIIRCCELSKSWAPASRPLSVKSSLLRPHVPDEGLPVNFEESAACLNPNACMLFLKESRKEIGGRVLAFAPTKNSEFPEKLLGQMVRLPNSEIR